MLLQLCSASTTKVPDLAHLQSAKRVYENKIHYTAYYLARPTSSILESQRLLFTKHPPRQRPVQSHRPPFEATARI